MQQKLGGLRIQWVAHAAKCSLQRLCLCWVHVHCCINGQLAAADHTGSKFFFFGLYALAYTEVKYRWKNQRSIILPLFQTLSHSGFSRYIAFAMHLDTMCLEKPERFTNWNGGSRC